MKRLSLWVLSLGLGLAAGLYAGAPVSTFTLSVASDDLQDDSGAVVVTDAYPTWGTPCDGAQFISHRSDGQVSHLGQVLSFTRSFEIPDYVNINKAQFHLSYKADDHIRISINDVIVADCTEAVCFFTDEIGCVRSVSPKKNVFQTGTNVMNVVIRDNPDFGVFIMGSYALVMTFEGVAPTPTPAQTPTLGPTFTPTPAPSFTSTPTPSVSPTPSVTPCALCQTECYNPVTHCCVIADGESNVRDKFNFSLLDFDFSDCPDRRARDGYTATENGCTWSPDSYYGIGGVANFTPACNDHDLCFGRCLSRFGQCNDRFFTDMSSACIEAFPGSLLNPITLRNRFGCASAAYAYQAAVQSVGYAFYSAAQREACQCC